jgi:hypothetical protein
MIYRDEFSFFLPFLPRMTYGIWLATSTPKEGTDEIGHAETKEILNC